MLPLNLKKLLNIPDPVIYTATDNYAERL